MEKLESVTKALQDRIMSFSEAQTMFDGIIEIFHLCVPCYHHGHLLYTILSLGRQSLRLNVAKSGGERKAIQHLRLPDSCTSDESLKPPKLSFAEQLLKRDKFNHGGEDSKYLDLRFLLSKSNICERLFSVAVDAI